jgi:MHS family alpha-ketoglutarate permease-like MFS transporter
VTLIAGQLLALCVLLLLQSVLPDDQMRAWGWRIPFVLGGMMAVVVVVMRRRMAETPAFEGVAGAETRPGLSLALVREHPRAVLLVMALTAGGTLAFYAYSVYMQKFLVNTAGLSVATASRVMTAALFLFMLVQPLAGLLSDRVGRKPLLIGFGVAGVLGTVPIFRALETVDSGLEAFPLVMAALIIVTGYSATGAVVKSELFPAHIRTLGVALPYALANTVFGGTAEYVALWFKSIGHESGFYWYVTGVIGLSLIAYLLMRETLHDGTLSGGHETPDRLS